MVPTVEQHSIDQIDQVPRVRLDQTLEEKELNYKEVLLIRRRVAAAVVLKIILKDGILQHSNTES
jgi:deoxyribose-phosphate aldolase